MSETPEDMKYCDQVAQENERLTALIGYYESKLAKNGWDEEDFEEAERATSPSQ